MEYMMTVDSKIHEIESVIHDQIQHGPSETAMFRLGNLVNELKSELKTSRSFKVGTAEFNMYVFNKVNCNKDIDNIAARYEIPREDVLEAYMKGSTGT